MRRLASAFLTLWLILFVPSLIIWLLVVRWGETDAGRFASVWNWVVDLIAFPLILSPLTDWAWREVETGTMLTATVGFLVLNAIWAALFALPLALVSGWWRTIGDRTVGSSTSGTPAYADPYSTSVIPIPGRTSSSPLAGFYVITIPLGLLWAGISGLFGGPQHPVRRFLSPIFWSLVIVTAVTFGLFAIQFGRAASPDKLSVLHTMLTEIWYGYLDTLRLPRLFDERWREALDTIALQFNSGTPREWRDYAGQWYLHGEFWWFVGLLALRHALAVATVVALIQLIRVITGGLRE